MLNTTSNFSDSNFTANHFATKSTFKLKTKHFLTGEELSRDELIGLLDLADSLKEERSKGILRKDLFGKNMTLLFEKPSLRTRVSFTVALQELGANAVELVSITRKKEEPKDTVCVLGTYSHGIMVRTFEHRILQKMAESSPVPIVNGLSDSHHPCQVLADLLTLKQTFGNLAGLKLAYIGDGNNMLHSLFLLLPFLGVHVHYSCPEGYEPNSIIVKNAKKRAIEGGGSITDFENPLEAVKGVDAIYTDVWASMGQESEEAEKEKAFTDYQVNEELYSHAKKNAIILHCMPMARGKEITDAMADHKNAKLYPQAENRLHAQKALLIGLMG